MFVDLFFRFWWRTYVGSIDVVDVDGENFCGIGKNVGARFVVYFRVDRFDDGRCFCKFRYVGRF